MFLDFKKFFLRERFLVEKLSKEFLRFVFEPILKYSILFNITAVLNKKKIKEKGRISPSPRVSNSKQINFHSKLFPILASKHLQKRDFNRR